MPSAAATAAGERRLADAGLPFEEQRALQRQREEEGDGQAAVGDVVLRAEALLAARKGSRTRVQRKKMNFVWADVPLPNGHRIEP